MFKSSYQSGFLSLLYSIGSKPLSIWGSEGAGARPPHRPALPPSFAASTQPHLLPLPLPSCPHAVENGHIKRVTDEDIQSSVLEVGRRWPPARSRVLRVPPPAGAPGSSAPKPPPSH